MTSQSPHAATRGPTTDFQGACVASSQNKASEIGINILKSGGNAADAAVAVAAALNVLSPCCTGIGGDCFCLFYNAATKTVKGLNGSGRSSMATDLETVRQLGFNRDNPIPITHGLNVTVPGAAAGWLDTLSEFGSKKLSVQQVLEHAIHLAEDGFTVQPVAAHWWEHDSVKLKRETNPHGRCFLKEGRAPRAGETMKLPLLAQTFKELASKGKPGFYEGRVGQGIVDIVKTNGGTLSLQDLKEHTSCLVEPIFADYKDLRVWEIPPNGQGITTLLGLNILEGVDLKAMRHNSVKYLHHLIEATKLSFADSLWYCCDPKHSHVPTQQLLSKTYAAERRKLMHPQRAGTIPKHGDVIGSSGDTVYFCVVDQQGNACSFINSNYNLFGTGLVPEGCGFTLHNRGTSFSLEPGHPNALAPGKRPYHTIIPSMLTDANTGNLLAAFGVMGGYMQPQGQIQVLLSMCEFGMTPQEALNQPRFYVEVEQTGLSGRVFLEEGFDQEVLQELKSMGHDIVGPISGWDRGKFGRGQIITLGDWYRKMDATLKLLNAGGDLRGDGQPVGY